MPELDSSLPIIRSRIGEALARTDEILSAVDDSWSPPPYDPRLVAHALGIRCIEISSLSQAALLLVRDGEPTILYREMRSQERTRFNLFHEIAHTLFADYTERADLRGVRPRCFEPHGRLEHLCDTAALEFMMPNNLFEDDLIENGFGVERVEALCRRFGVWPEAVCHRMIESDLECCALAQIDYVRSRGRHAGRSRGASYRITYAAHSASFQRRRLFLPRHLPIDRDSPINEAARRRKPSFAETLLPLASGESHPFLVEALPLSEKRHRGRDSVLSFLYPR